MTCISKVLEKLIFDTQNSYTEIIAIVYDVALLFKSILFVYLSNTNIIKFKS